MFTNVYPCLLVFTYVYHCFSCLSILTVYSCLFTYIYSGLLVFAYVYPCLIVFTYVYSCSSIFTTLPVLVYQFLPMFTCVYLCLHLFIFYHCNRVYHYLLLLVYLCLLVITYVCPYLLVFTCFLEILNVYHFTRAGLHVFT